MTKTRRPSDPLDLGSSGDAPWGRQGAALLRMNTLSGRCVPWFPDNDMASGYFISTICPMIVTDKCGRRYADESLTAAGTTASFLSSGRSPVKVIR